ncbi:hypothetical protein ACEWY4_014014 [Coilia grayii]|uniref:Uncharacterized protein n=1 Tax=Coilia grayii TaxID=363190 RepID=A0ABD1JR73_9TELE
MYHVHLLLALITSVKTNNYLLYVQAIQEMCPIFFSFGGQNYARYMTYFSAFFANIDYSHAGASDLIRLGTFSVARSFISGNRCATDKTMEETFMRHAKSHGGTGEGLSGILTNYKAYQRWVRTTHLRSLYVDAALNMADMGNEGSDGNQHRDLRPTEIQRSDKELWSSDDYAVKLQGRKIILVCEDSAHLLTSDDGITTKIKELPLLKSSQEETDTRVVLYTQYAANSHYNTVRIKSPDSDIFFILLHFASTMDINILFDTKIQRRSRLINVTSTAADIGQEKCTALLGLHGFTGSDTSSAFRGKGKLVPVKKMLKAPKFVPMLAKLGDNWTVSEDLIDDLEAFTCAMYGDNTTAGKVDALRLNRINKLCTKQGKSIPVNVDMSSLPPCQKSLTQHIRRVNFQVAVWKRASIAHPMIPSAVQGHGWLMTDNGLQPLWYEGESHPENLQDLCEEKNEASYSDSDSSAGSDESDDSTGNDSDTNTDDQ